MARSLLNRTAIRNQIECGKNHTLGGFGARYGLPLTAALFCQNAKPQQNLSNPLKIKVLYIRKRLSRPQFGRNSDGMVAHPTESRYAQLPIASIHGRSAKGNRPVKG